MVPSHLGEHVDLLDKVIESAIQKRLVGLKGQERKQAHRLYRMWATATVRKYFKLRSWFLITPDQLKKAVELVLEDIPHYGSRARD